MQPQRHTDLFIFLLITQMIVLFLMRFLRCPGLPEPYTNDLMAHLIDLICLESRDKYPFTLHYNPIKQALKFSVDRDVVSTIPDDSFAYAVSAPIKDSRRYEKMACKILLSKIISFHS